MQQKSLTLQEAITPGGVLVVLKKPPKTLNDAKTILSDLIAAYCRGAVVGESAKTLGYLLTVFVQLSTAADLETRLDKLETAFNKGGKR